MSRPVFRIFAAIAAMSFLVSTSADDQPAENPENDNILSGTIVSLTTEDRLTTLVVDVGGEQQEYRLTRQIEFEVRGPGDAGFLTQGAYIETRAIMSNNQLFPESLTVRVAGRGQRNPPGIIREVPREEASADNRYDISGTIAEVAQDPMYAQYTQLAVRSAQDVVLMAREGLAITVSFSGHEHAVAGDPIELQVMRLRNGRINLEACRVTKTAAFDSTTILGTADEDEE